MTGFGEGTADSLTKFSYVQLPGNYVILIVFKKHIRSCFASVLSPREAYIYIYIYIKGISM